jgi:hypothetical protein
MKGEIEIAAQTIEGLEWSGRKDLNLRPPGPEPGALARLRYAPTMELAGENLSLRADGSLA